MTADLGVRLASGPAPGQIVLSVTGDIDFNSAPQLRDALSRSGAAPAWLVVVDLSGVPFMATDGIHALLDASDAMRAEGASLVLACADPSVARVLSLIGVDQLIPVAATLTEALAR
jgi:anti-anti-sigma factor